MVTGANWQLRERILLVGPVVGAWALFALLPAVIIGGSLGHISRALVVPAFIQALLGAGISSLVVLRAPTSALGSGLVALAIGFAATTGTFAILMAYWEASLSDLGATPVLPLLFVLSQLAAFACRYKLRKALAARET